MPRGKHVPYVPDWYRPILTQINRVRKVHGPSLRHLEEVLAIGEMVPLPKDLKQRIVRIMVEVDRLKVECRALYLAEQEQTTTQEV